MGQSCCQVPVGDGVHMESVSTEERDNVRFRTMIAAGEEYGCEWLRHLRDSVTDDRIPVVMIMVGDFGVDVDDEKALCIAVALLRVGVLHSLAVVANTGDSKMRARLAKGTLQQLSAGDCPVAAGTTGASLGDDREYEFGHCKYLASEDELDPRGGHELIFATLEDAAREKRQVCFVLNSALTDMMQVLRDPRWPNLLHVVNNVTAMGGVVWKSDELVMDPLACNNVVDVPAAVEVYARLSQQVPFYVVSRHASSKVQLATGTFNGSLHPVAKRFVAVAVKSTQAVWERVHMSMEQRRKANDSLPARCDVNWYYNAFLKSTAPRSLTAEDQISPWLRGLNVYDGLSTLVSSLVSIGDISDFFDVISGTMCTTRVIGLDERRHGIKNMEHVSDLMWELIVMVIGSGDGAWWRRLVQVSSSSQPVDLIMIGDFGKDLDDEKALCVAVAFRKLGLVRRLGVVANLGDSVMRARLAKGTLNELGARDCPVAAGSHGGQPGEELYEHEFKFADYLAVADALYQQRPVDLVFDMLDAAMADNTKACIVLNSALTDMHSVLEDPRWTKSRAVVAAIAAMGGVTEQGGTLGIDPTAANNAFDLRSAERVYATLQAKENDQPPFIVVSRHAAGACQMPRRALDGSTHPVAKRLVGVSEPALQKLWERCYRSKEEREEAKDALPMRCDASWFRSTFLDETSPESLGAGDKVWQHVKGFNEYDALTTIAVVAACHAGVFNEFFEPTQCTHSNLMAIGVDANLHSIVDPASASELLHDCLVHSFDTRFSTSMMLEYNVRGKWEKIQLLTPVRSKGADCWRAILGAVSEPLEVYFEGSSEGTRWRRLKKLGPGHDELVLRAEGTTLHYRWVGGMQAFPFLSQAAWEIMREQFIPDSGDVFLCGPIGCGRAPLQITVLALKAGSVEKVDMGRPYTIEISMARGAMDIPGLESIPPEDRVFKMMMPGERMSFRHWKSGWPPGIKVIYCLRDPRDLACRNFTLFGRFFADDASKVTWPAFLNYWYEGTMQGIVGSDWLETSCFMWEKHKAFPNQVLWLSFEDFIRDRANVIARIAHFLDCPVSDVLMQDLVRVTQFSETKRLYGKDMGPILQKGLVGDYVNFFSKEDLARFRREIIQPAISAGLSLPPEYLLDREPV